MAGKKKRGFTAKQKAFIREWPVDRNGTQAAIRAGYSARTAAVTASQLLTNPKIRAAIDAHEKKLADRAEKTGAEIIKELERIGFSNMAEFVEFGSKKGLTINDLSALSEDAKRCVSEVAVTKSKSGGSLRFKLHNKEKALELLGKRFGLFPDKVEVSGDVSFADLADMADDDTEETDTGSG